MSSNHHFFPSITSPRSTLPRHSGRNRSLLQHTACAWPSLSCSGHVLLGGKSATTVFGVGLKPSLRTLGRTPFYILTFTQWGKKIDIESFNR